MIYHYRAYGLACSSNVSIDGFYAPPISPQTSDVDVVFDLFSVLPGWVDAARRLPARAIDWKSASLEDADSGCTVRVFGSADAFELNYADGTQFFIDGPATRVWGNSPPGFDVDYLATYLRGPLLGFILRRRGVTALHASALSVCRQAVLLCGESQSGKSTIAAALALNGTPVLCEDVAALRANGDAYNVEPGYAQVGLWPDMVETLLRTPDALPRLTSSWEKCFLPLDGHRAKFDSEERPLGLIYLIAPRTNFGNAPRIEPLNPREALLGLVQNTYMNWLLDRKQRAAEFDFLSTLVTRIPVRLAVPHSDPVKIAALCDLIVADAQRHQSTPFVSSR